MMETCLFLLGTAENLEALPALLQLENIFVLSSSPPVRILNLTQNARAKKGPIIPETSSSTIQPQCHIKNIVQRKTYWYMSLLLLFFFAT